MGCDASVGETHFEEGDNEVFVESFVCPGSVELETKLMYINIACYNVVRMYIIVLQ